MEVNDPAADPESIWYVTNGLLVREMITGQVQVGDDAFEPREPSALNVAGDLDDPNGPTYATFNSFLTAMRYRQVPQSPSASTAPGR